MRRRRQPVVPSMLVDQISEALAAVDATRAELERVRAAHPSLSERREAHARVRHAFDDADVLLREACAVARRHGYRDWSLWRHRLSTLDAARQIHLLAEQDQPGLLPLGSVRAIDTGMSGPDLGDLQHGQSRPAGTLPTYGLDLETLLTDSVVDGSTSAGPGEEPFIEPPRQAAETDAPGASPEAPSPRAA